MESLTESSARWSAAVRPPGRQRAGTPYARAVVREPLWPAELARPRVSRWSRKRGRPPGASAARWGRPQRPRRGATKPLVAAQPRTRSTVDADVPVPLVLAAAAAAAP